MTVPEPNSEQRLEALKSGYHRSLGTKLAQLRSCWEQCRDTQYADTYLAKLCLLAHRIAGSAGSYGYGELSGAAVSLDRHLQHMHGECDTDGIEKLNTLYHKLHHVLSETAFNTNS